MVCLVRHFLRNTTVMARKMITRDELNARARANGYQTGAHGEEDSCRDRNKLKDDTKIKMRRWIDMCCKITCDSLNTFCGVFFAGFNWPQMPDVLRCNENLFWLPLFLQGAARLSP